jgi:aldose 1-epimerase
MKLENSSFGFLPDGREVRLITLTHPSGARLRFINLGLIVVSLEVPDRTGKPGNVVLGFDNLARYVQGHPFFGVIAGRYANRIAHGRFTLDGQSYQLATNNHGIHHLHGGREGFDKKLWIPGHSYADQYSAWFECSYRSVDGEESYPGTLDVTIRYTFTADHTFRIDYRATTDKATIVNLTNHSFFNLSGAGSILDHQLLLNASHVTAVDPTLIPTGTLAPVAGTPLDFLRPTAIGTRNMAAGLAVAGYDHNFVLDRTAPGLTLAARATDAASGRVLECHTDQPAVQLYTFNFAPAEGIVCANQIRFERHGAFCLETQHFPDSPNHPHFPSTVLRPGETFQSTTEYRFSTLK